MNDFMIMIRFLLLAAVFGMAAGAAPAQTEPSHRTNKEREVVFTLCRYPPVPNPAYDRFDALFNSRIPASLLPDSTCRIYLAFTIREDSTADFDSTLQRSLGGPEVLRQEMLTLLKTEVQWIAAKTNDELRMRYVTERGKKKQKQVKVPVTVDFGITLEFEATRHGLRLVYYPTIKNRDRKL